MQKKIIIFKIFDYFYNTMVMSSKSLVDRLKQVINDLGMTQNEFARSIGITAGGLSDILRGKTRVPSGSVFKAIEYRYGVSGAWLLYGEGKQWLKDSPKSSKQKPAEEISEIENIYNALDRINQRLLLNFSRTLKTGQSDNSRKKVKK